MASTGAGRELAAAQRYTTTATGELAGAEQQRQAAEARLSEQELLLGTEAQAAGELDVDTRLEPYTHRYGFEAGTIAGLGGRGGQLRGGGRVSKNLVSQWMADWESANPGASRQERRAAQQEFRTRAKDVTRTAGGYAEFARDEANALMQQAQDAAAAGNYEEADRLKAEAESVLGRYQPDQRQGAQQWMGAFRLEEDPRTAAARQLSAPGAQIVGELVRQGREFLDPESATSQRFRESLTRPAELAIAGEARGAARAQRELALGAGGARRLGAEAAGADQIGRTVAQQRAAVHAQAGAAFEQYSRAFAQNAAGFAQAYLQNQAGIREAFQSNLQSLAVATSQAQLAGAQMMMQYAQLSAQAHLAQKEYDRSMMAGLAGLGAGIITGLIPGVGQMNPFGGGGGEGGGAPSGGEGEALGSIAKILAIG